MQSMHLGVVLAVAAATEWTGVPTHNTELRSTKWTTFPAYDTSAEGRILCNSVDSLDRCEQTCIQGGCLSNCTGVSWNQRSHHCYVFAHATSTGLECKTNPHVITAVLASTKGCLPQPAPAPTPTPNPPLKPTKYPVLIDIPVPEKGITFKMGYSRTPLSEDSLGRMAKVFPNGDADESPAHYVTLTKIFAMGQTEVTNAQYELFDPDHRKKFSSRPVTGTVADDNDPALFVSYEDAQAYAHWLSHSSRLNRTVRLPTEAEWEYAARGGLSNGHFMDYFWTGDTIPEQMQNNQQDADSMPLIPTNQTPVSQRINLRVGRFAPNPLGLYDTLGNAEEWCSDWFGPYPSSNVTDPKGHLSGTFRVTRGGSHSTSLYYLRSANRAGSLPKDRTWHVGFRIASDNAPVITSATSISENTETVSKLLKSKILPKPSPSSDESWPNWNIHMNETLKIRRYVNIPEPAGGSQLPFDGHNHEPTIAACPDGSLYANWYSTNCGEPGRCVGLVDSRLETASTANWTSARVQMDVPDRNQCCTALFRDRFSNVLYHWSAVGVASGFQSIMGILQNSTDCGRTWSNPEIIWPKHGIQHQIVVTIIHSLRTNDIIIPCDHFGNMPYDELGDQSVAQHAPLDRIYDQSAWRWTNPNKPDNDTSYTSTFSHHSSIVELRNGSFLAVGRSHDIDGTMPMAVSKDGGYTFVGLQNDLKNFQAKNLLPIVFRILSVKSYTWSAHASQFTGIHGGQREVMVRLGSIGQPLMHCTFANGPPQYNETLIPHQGGGYFPVVGLYCALSFDEGESWDTRRPMTTDFTKNGHLVEGFDGNKFTMAYNSAEPNGYMAATVSDDGLIHLITSRNHYQFSLKWLNSTAPAPPSF